MVCVSARACVVVCVRVFTRDVRACASVCERVRVSVNSCMCVV